jgi:hypothetical protein
MVRAPFGYHAGEPKAADDTVGGFLVDLPRLRSGGGTAGRRRLSDRPAGGSGA